MARAGDRDLDTRGASERRHPAARRTEASAVERRGVLSKRESPGTRDRRLASGGRDHRALDGHRPPATGHWKPRPRNRCRRRSRGSRLRWRRPADGVGRLRLRQRQPGPVQRRGLLLSAGILRIADVRDCVPAATFYTNTFNVHERQQPEGFPGVSARSTWFMIEYTGVFSVASDGNYEFRLHSDDGSFLLIDGALVIDNDGKHQPESRRANIRLTAGDHRLQLLYAQTTDRMALQLYVRPPGSNDERLFRPGFEAWGPNERGRRASRDEHRLSGLGYGRPRTTDR